MVTHSTTGRTITVGLAAALALTACAGSDTGTSASDNGRAATLVIAENEVPASFDPVQADNSTVNEVVIPAYDSLFTYDESTELTGVLVESWAVSEDGTTIDLTLRDDVVFHDGTTMSAEDVVYTLDRIRALDIGVAAFITAYESAEAISETELQIALSAPDATFLPALTGVYILNSELVEENAGDDYGQSWLATNDAGSGPYELVEYTTNQAARYTHFADYWQGFNGQAEHLEFRYLTEASAQSQALQRGDVDIAMDISPTEWETFDEDDGFTVDRADTTVALYTFFNMEDEVTADPILREAISYAYDYDQHVETILQGAGNPMVGPLPDSMQCSTEDGVTAPEFDLEYAEELVNENGLEGTTVTMTYLEATSEMEQAATLLQSNLAEIGIILELQTVTYPQYAEMSAEDETRPQLGMIYAFPAYPDPSAILYQNFHSQFIGGGANWGAYSNPEVDELTESAQQESDPEVRCDSYEEVQRIVAEDYASLNLANSQTVAVMDERVEGYEYRSWHHQTVDVYSITLSD